MLYQRPITEQICVASNMLKTLASEAKNLSNPTIIEDEYGKYVALGGYEIWWRDDVPNHFEITVGSITPGSYWEPPDYQVIELAIKPTLYEAVMFVVQHSIQLIYQQYMESESEYHTDMEIKNSFQKYEEPRYVSA